MKIVVLGAGLVGGPMAVDLAQDSRLAVHVVDVRDDALTRVASLARVTTEKADCGDAEVLARVTKDADIVLAAVPSFMGYRTLQTLVGLGKKVVDIAFFSEDPLTLHENARRTGAVALVDMGVAPGMSSVLAGRVHADLDETTSIVTYVAGLPRVRKWPYEYKAVFSPMDVIEEYTRPARYVENGHLVTRPALSDPEYLDFPRIGTLEAFNTDGLRTMAKTLKVPNMKEKTMRYPGHIEKMLVLRESGFFGTDPIDIGGVQVRPLDVTAKLMFAAWRMEPREIDITVLRVIVDGKKDGKSRRVTWELHDEYDAASDTHSMARTTGYTATSAVRMLARGLFAESGVWAPEQLGANAECVAFLLAELKKRGVAYEETIS